MTTISWHTAHAKQHFKCTSV